MAARLIAAALAVLLAGCVATLAGESDFDAAKDAIAALEKANSSLTRLVMDNGMICLIKEDHYAPVVSVQIWVGTGSIHEQEYLGSGLSHAIEHMIFKGTEKRGVGDLTREINEAGGDINAYTTLDRTVFHTSLPSRSWRLGLDALADSVMHSTFPEKEWAKEKQVILRELAMNRDDPDRVLGKLLWATAFSVHPYRFPVIGYEDVFKKLTRRDLLQFARRNYVPDNMIAVIAGDINAREVEAAMRDTFGGFQRRARSPVVLPQEPAQISPRFARQTGPYKVSRLEWAYHTTPLSHPDAAPLDVLAEIVGEGASSRLVREIKERQRLVHSVGASSHTLRESGIFAIDATFDPAKESEAIAAIQKEVDSWTNSLFAKEEVAKAQRMLLAGELADLQTVEGEANSRALGEFYAQDPNFSATYLRRVAAVNAEAIQAAAKGYFQPENRTLVVLSPVVEAVPASTNAVVSITNALPVKVALSIGAPLIAREDRRLPFVYICASLGGGVLSETGTNNGITKLMADTLTRGTKTRSRIEIAQTVDSLGGLLAPYSGYNGFGIQARCLSADAGTIMALMADCLLNPSFPEEEIERQKIEQMSEIDQERERPAFAAKEALRQMLFPNHPYRWSQLGEKAIVGKIKRGEIEKHYRKHVVSGNLVIAIFGDITPAEAKALAENSLAGIPRGEAPQPLRERANPSLPARAKLTRPNEQAVLLVGFPGIDVKDSRSDALTILQTAMGGLSSDLGIAVREERGLAYYVGAYQQTGLDPGSFVIYAGTREDAAREVEKLMDREVARLTSKGLRKEELERAKRQIIAEYEMSLQDNLGTAMRCALDELYGLGFQHAFDTKRRFEGIAGEDVRRAAASILVMDRKATSLVLPEAKEKKSAKAGSKED